jgi:hypothetical protein
MHARGATISGRVVAAAAMAADASRLSQFKKQKRPPRGGLSIFDLVDGGPVQAASIKCELCAQTEKRRV